MIELTEVEARARLEAMIQWTVEPPLTSAEVDRLLAMAKRADKDEITPATTGWTPTWDLNAGAAEGWRWKAGKVAGRFNANLDGAALQRAQIFGHCLKMASDYASKVAGSMSVARFPSESNAIANL